jgi:hypothetical protein
MSQETQDNSMLQETQETVTETIPNNNAQPMSTTWMIVVRLMFKVPECRPEYVLIVRMTGLGIVHVTPR